MPSLRLTAEAVANTHTHDQAVAHIKTLRPRGQYQSYDGCEFWGEHRNRAILLYALISRPGTIFNLVESVELPDVSKLYVFLREWKIAFKAFLPAPSVEATGEDHRVEKGTLSYDGERYWLTLPTGRKFAVRYTFYNEWVIERDSGPDLTLTHALDAAEEADMHLTFGGVPIGREELLEHLEVYAHAFTKSAIQPHRLIPGEYLVPRDVVSGLFGERATLAAIARHNRCLCTYWSDASFCCGLVTHNPTAPEGCEDFHALEADA